MAKSRFLSWFGLGDKKKKAEEAAQQQAEQERLIKEQEAAQEKEAQELAEKEAAEQAERELAEKQRLEEEARLAQEQAAKEQAEKEAAKEQAEKEAAEQAARELAEKQRLEEEARLAQEQAVKEQAEKEAAEQAARELAEKQRLEEEARLAQEQAAKEQAEKEAAEQAARELAEKQRLEEEARLAQEQAAKEQAEIEAAEQAARELAEKQRLEEEARLAQEQAAKEQAEKEAVEQAARELAEKQRLEEEARLAQEQAAKELAEKEAAEQAARELAEKQRLEEEARFAQEQAAKEQAEQEKPKKKEGLFARLKKGLIKTKQNIGFGFASIFSGKKIDDELFEELETQLLTADVGVDTTMKLIDNLTDAADRKQLKDGDALFNLMKQEMTTLLDKADKPLVLDSDKKPFVILMVGVNGVGKTTTIGKLAKQFQLQGKSVMLAAGDTFRAAAVEQLQVWGERNEIPVIAQHTGADSASVLYDAFEAAKARNADVLIADTAGRLQNKDNLMQELEKIARVMKKLDPEAPHEVMLTIDAGTGQNAISQVKLFDQAVGLTGITLTKLDGTAKGGVIFSVADQFNIPIRYIGVGEGIDDLRTFNSKDFIEALFDE